MTPNKFGKKSEEKEEKDQEKERDLREQQERNAKNKVAENQLYSWLHAEDE